MHLVFNVSRAQPLRPVLQQPTLLMNAPLNAFELSPAAFPNVVTLGVRSPPLGSLTETRNEFLVLSVGDPAELVRVVARTPEGMHLLEEATRKPCLTDGDLLLTSSWLGPVTSPAGLVFGPAGYSADIDLALAGMPTGTAAEQEMKTQTSYFKLLNALTDSKLNGFLGAPLQASVNLHIANAFQGVQHRQQHYLVELRKSVAAGMGGSLPAFPSGTFFYDANEVAALFEKARGDNAMTVAQVQEAFIAFSQGRLRLKLPTHGAWTTQPSSGFYFLFGEFALMAVECGLGSPWPQLARTLCMTRELYVLYYPPPAGVKLDVDAYIACNYAPLAVIPDIPSLVAEFDAMSDQDLVRRSAEQTDKYLKDLPLPP